MSMVASILLLAGLWMSPSRPLQEPAKPILHCLGGSDVSDDLSAYFCRRLGEEGQAQERFEVVTEREPSDARIELKSVDSFASQGEITVLTKEEWGPEQERVRVEAVLTLGETVTSFTGEGDLWEATAEVVEAIHKWVRSHPDDFVGIRNR